MGKGMTHRALVRRGLTNTVCAACFELANQTDTAQGAELLDQVGLSREVLVSRVGEAEADRVTQSLNVQGLNALAELEPINEGRSCAACAKPTHW
jgi:hypothetical protein